MANALVHLQAHYHHCGEAASENCLSVATFVRRHAPQDRNPQCSRAKSSTSIAPVVETSLEIGNEGKDIGGTEASSQAGPKLVHKRDA